MPDSLRTAAKPDQRTLDREEPFICSDGGVGRNNSGLTALEPANEAGIPGAAVSAASARMGDGMSTWVDGEISAVNDLAADLGITPGMSARQAASILVNR